MNKSTLQQAIEAIENLRILEQNESHEARAGLTASLSILRSLLPAEEEQRKEVARQGFNAGYDFSSKPHQLDFETWYNEKYKKG
jgi:hypothetical protein